MKNILLSILLSSLVIGAKNNNDLFSVRSHFSSFEDDCKRIGFSVGKDWHVCSLTNRKQSFVLLEENKTVSNEIQYQYSTNHVVLQYEESPVYAYLSQTTIIPNANINNDKNRYFFRGFEVAHQLPENFEIGSWAPGSTNSVDANYAKYRYSFLKGDSLIEAKKQSFDNDLGVIAHVNIVTNCAGANYRYHKNNEFSSKVIILYTILIFKAPNFKISDFPEVQFTLTYYDSKTKKEDVSVSYSKPYEEIIKHNYVSDKK